MVAFEVFGDSNVARSWKAVASDGKLTGSVLRQTTTLVSLRDTLKTVGQGTKAILVSAVTNPITRLKYEGLAQMRVSVLDCFDEICDFLIQTTNNNPELKVRLIFIKCNNFQICFLFQRNIPLFMLILSSGPLLNLSSSIF
jgi:hypothetical protein